MEATDSVRHGATDRLLAPAAPRSTPRAAAATLRVTRVSQIPHPNAPAVPRRRTGGRLSCSLPRMGTWPRRRCCSTPAPTRKRRTRCDAMPEGPTVRRDVRAWYCSVGTGRRHTAVSARASLRVALRESRSPLPVARARTGRPAPRVPVRLHRPLPAAQQNGRTPLMWAAYFGHAQAARLLLDVGAVADARDSVSVATTPGPLTRRTLGVWRLCCLFAPSLVCGWCWQQPAEALHHGFHASAPAQPLQCADWRDRVELGAGAESV